MRKALMTAFIVILLFSLLVSSSANSGPNANPVFHMTSLYLYESFYVQFSASTRLLFQTISVAPALIEKIITEMGMHQTLTPLAILLKTLLYIVRQAITQLINQPVVPTASKLHSPQETNLLQSTLSHEHTEVR